METRHPWPPGRQCDGPDARDSSDRDLKLPASAVAGAFIAIGANNINHLSGFICPPRHCSGDTEFCVIRVSGKNHHIASLCHRKPPDFQIWPKKRLSG